MKNKDRRWVVTAALAFVLVLVMIATPFSGAVSAKTPEKSAPTAKAPPYGGTFKIGFQSDLKGLNPCVVNDVWSWNVIGFVYDSLGGTSKATEESIPWTAESWTEDTPDHLNWTVKIRQGVKWHDGQPLTADDVVFSYNFLMDVSRYVSSLESLDWTQIPGATDKNETYYEGVKKVDTYTVKFKLWRTNPTVLLDVMGIPLLPKHIWRNHWNDKTTWNMDYNPTTGEANVIGSGPFKFKYWKQGVEAKIERNEYYFWEATLEDGNTYKVPFVDAIQFIIYKNMDAMVTALKQGVIDYIWWSIDPGWVPVVSQIPGAKVFTNADRGYFYLMFNMILPFQGYDTGTGYQPRDDENSPITYPNPQGGQDAGLPFRKAVSHCIDKEYIVTRLMQGFGTKGDSIVPPSYTYWYNDTLPQYPFSVDTAKSILQAANYTDVNGDGWREDYKGRTMDGPNNNGQIDILTPPADYDPIRAEAGKKIAEAMKSAGIKAESVPTSFGQIVDEVFVYRNFEMFILGWRLGLDPGWVYDFFNSKFDWNNPGIGDGGNNPSGYRNQYYDQISSKVMEEMDPATRVALVKECQGMIAKHLPTNVLYYRQMLEVADASEWVGYHEKPGGIGNGWTMMEIHKPLQQPPLRVDVKAFPASMPGTKNATLKLTVSAVKADGTAYPNVNVNMKLEPTPDPTYIGLDATQKTTDANGKAEFIVICKENYPLDTVFKAVVNATDGTNYANANTYFTISMAGLNVEVTSPQVVVGTASNTFYFNITVRQFTTPLSGAQVELQTLSPPDNLKILKVRANTDANGTVSLGLQVTGNFTASKSVELKYTVWPAGGAKTLYTHNFVVLANGGNEVSVAVDTIGTLEGLPGKTKEVNVTVTSGGSPLPGASVYGYITPTGKGLSVVETDPVDTGTDGKATFNVKVDSLVTIDTSFKFVAVVASGTYAGYGSAPAQVSAVTTMNAALEVNPASITGNVGQSTTVKVTVTSGGTPIEGATVSLDITPATTALEVAPTTATTNTNGIATFTVTVKSAITSDTTYTITGHATYSTLTATGTGSLDVKAGENINVDLQLSKTQVAGITGAELTATVTVLNGTAPMSNVDVSLVLNPSTGLSAETGKKTGTDGKAVIKITVTQTFSADATVSVKAVATVGTKTYESAASTLTVKYVPYAITVTLEATQIDGKKDAVVNATVKVLNGTTPMQGINATLTATPSANLQISPATAQTDANGEAKFTITLTADFQTDTPVTLEPKATIDAVEYTGATTTLTIKGIAAAYTVTMTLDKTEIEGKKDNTVKATIYVKTGNVGVANVSVTVTFDQAGLSANTATTDQNGKAEVTITITEDFTAEKTVKVTPKVAGQEFASSAVNLKVTPKTTTTPGFELIGVIAAIAAVAGILVYARRKEH
ncbi:MAG: ABC transporter substrate-binding protein [Thermoplasmata archaeon]|nr:ABC transporter substrate-binding protein [Thermoplasmata archaeon]